MRINRADINLKEISEDYKKESFYVLYHIQRIVREKGHRKLDVDVLHQAIKNLRSYSSITNLIDSSKQQIPFDSLLFKDLKYRSDDDIRVNPHIFYPYTEDQLRCFESRYLYTALRNLAIQVGYNDSYWVPEINLIQDSDSVELFISMSGHSSGFIIDKITKPKSWDISSILNIYPWVEVNDGANNELSISYFDSEGEERKITFNEVKIVRKYR